MHVAFDIHKCVLPSVFVASAFHGVEPTVVSELGIVARASGVVTLALV